jgi:hypothetical protein
MANTFKIDFEQGDIIWNGEPCKSPIIYAFTFNGVRYFHFSSFDEMPVHRAITADVFLKEMNEGINKDKQLLFMESIKDSLNRGNLMDAAKYLGFLEDLMTLVFQPDTYLKLASVYYLSEKESPFYFDYGYNVKKVQEWMKGGVSAELDFFYKTPLKQLVPQVNFSENDLEAFLKVVRRIEGNQLQHILSQSFSNTLTADSRSYLESQAEALEKWNASNDLPFMNITSFGNLNQHNQTTD